MGNESSILCVLSFSSLGRADLVDGMGSVCDKGTMYEKIPL